MESRTHISVKNLSVRYGRQCALNNVTIDIPDKKITAIIGPSGCGKTTLLKSFNRLIDLHAGVKVTGAVMVDGEDIYGPGVEVTHLRRKMGYLSQRPQVLPMSIYDNVAYGPRLYGRPDRKKLAELIERHLNAAGLWNEVKDRLNGPASRLSIGQQQRLCLARGLAVEPEAILGDEPTSALDPISAEHIEQRFLGLKNQYTIVLVTHILRQARRLADYVIFLYLGNIIEHGPAKIFFEKPRYAKTQAYLNGQPIPEFKADKELNLKDAAGPAEFFAAKSALAGLNVGQVLKVIVANEPVAAELSNALELDGHKVLEAKQINPSEREIIIRKEEVNYAV